MKDAVLYSPVVGRLVLGPLVRLGYWAFLRTGRTPPVCYAGFRKLHCVTRGEINRELSGAIARASAPIEIEDPTGLLGDRKDCAALRETVDRDGYAVSPHRLDPAMCAELMAFATATPANRVPSVAGDPSRARFDPAAPTAPRYQFDEAALLTVPAVRRLVGDPSFIDLAGKYFGSPPINDLVTMWWSAPFGPPSSEAAQLFHFDMDRIRFLKLFIYLTDVGTDNGPHVYVRGSHRTKPPAFFRDRRFSDREVASGFPASDVHELHGPAGTVFVADTSGMHKGKPLIRGQRLVLQLELASSLFGQAYERHRTGRLPPEDPLALAMRRFPSVLQRFHAEAR